MGLTSLEDTIKAKAMKHNNAHFMLVDGMSKLMTQKVKWHCESLDFSASGLKWKLVIRPDAAKDNLAFYLHITDELCTDSNWKVNCSFKLCIISQTGPPDICIAIDECFDTKHKSWGRETFISRKVLENKYIVDDKAVFFAVISVVKPKFLKVTSISPTMGTVERLKPMEVPRNMSRFTWKITQFSSFDGEHHSSYEFTVGPRRWCLQIYPKGCLEGKDNSLSLFLLASDYVNNVPKEATSAVYILRVLDQFKRNHREKNGQGKFYSNSRWGFRKFLPLEELHKASNGFLVNDEIYVSVESLFVSPHESL